MNHKKTTYEIVCSINQHDDLDIPKMRKEWLPVDEIRKEIEDLKDYVERNMLAKEKEPTKIALLGRFYILLSKLEERLGLLEEQK